MDRSIAALAGALACTGALSAGPLEDGIKGQLQQKLAAAINEQERPFDIDRRRSNAVGVFGGNSFSGHGKTGVATIESETEGEGVSAKFIFRSTVPWSGRWTNKSWSPFNHYKAESKHQSGVLHVVYRIHALGGKVEVVSCDLTRASETLDHDSVEMPVEAIRSAVLTDVGRLRIALFD